MDNRELKNLIKLFNDSNVNELKLKQENFEIELKKEQCAVPFSERLYHESAPIATEVAPAPAGEKQKTNVSSTSEVAGDFINSPMVGSFYASPSPEAGPFVKVGDTVSKGQTLCIVEAMKIMNEIEAEFDCKIIEVLVNDADPLEFDMPIFKVEKI